MLIKGGGTIVCKELEEGRSLRVTSGSIVAFEPTVSYDVQMMPGKCCTGKQYRKVIITPPSNDLVGISTGIKNAMFGGEGLFITTLQGPGRVWLQGMPSDRMIAEIARRVPSGGPGIGIPIGGGGTAADAGEAGAGEDGAVVEEGGGEEMVAATDAAVEADRQATVASSGAMSTDDIDSESQSALFGDAVNAKDQDTSVGDASTTNVDEFGEDPSWASSAEQPAFKDDDSFTAEESTFKDEDLFDDATTTEGLGLGETAAEEGGGGGILSTLWDFFMGGDD